MIPLDAPGSPPQFLQTHSLLFDLWTILILVGPIMGTFFPPETYFGLEGGFMWAILLVISVPALGIGAYQMAKQRNYTHCPLAYAYVVVVIVSTSWAGDPGYSFLRALRLLPLVSYAVIFANAYRMKDFLRLLTIASLVSALASYFVIIFMPALALSTLGGPYEHAMRGALIQKNAAGFCYANGMFFAAFAVVMGAVPRYLAAITAILCFGLLVLASSMTPVVSLVISAMIGLAVLFLTTLNRGQALLNAVTLIMLTTTALLVAINFPDGLAKLIGRDLTLTGRTQIWQAVIVLIKLNPFKGYGYAFWSFDSPQHEFMVRSVGTTMAYAHNSWLDLWLQTGFLGILSIALLTLASLSRAVKILKAHRGEGVLLLSFMLSLLIHSLAETQYNEPGIAGVPWLVWGATIAMVILRRARQKGEPQARYAWSSAAGDLAPA